MRIDKETVAHGLIAAFATASIISTPTTLACSPEPYIGSVCVTAAPFCPGRTHIEAKGQLLPINQYQTLYSLLGTNYGGNGTTDFGVPDMRGRTPVGAGTGPGLTPIGLGDKRGVEFMTLSLQQMPTHTHSASFTPDSGSSGAAVQASTKVAEKAQAANGDYIASNNPIGGNPKFISGTNAGATVPLGGVSGGGGSVALGDTGGNQPFANFPPQQALKYCIAVTGTYPSRP